MVTNLQVLHVEGERMARLSLRLLGAMQVTLDGTQVTGFESHKERALLAYLAEESQQLHRREKLAGLLWPERTERAARNNLRRVLSNLRRLLGDRAPSGTPFLLVTGQAVRFNPDSDAWIDSLTFAGLVSPLAQQTIVQLEEAIHLYQGDFLEGFSVAGSPAYEEWIVLRRERYQRMMMEALHRLVEECEGLGDYECALQLAWRQLDLEPWWEEAHQHLIRLLALSGRRSEAIAQYVKCRRLLAEELDVEPSPETTGLFEQIRAGSLTGSRPSPRQRIGPTHNLPLTLGPFVGREEEIARIQDCLRNPACRLLTLVGAGGMGKTRLALEAVAGWMSQLREEEWEGVTLVSLAPLQTVESVLPAIAQAAGFQLSPDGDPGQQLGDHLGEKRWLLILDSFEHLADGAGFVADTLKAAPHVKILVTSRVRLNLRGEQCLPVAGIGFPERLPQDARDAQEYAAVRLFLQAAHQVQPGFEPTGADLTEISSICCLVQGMPLAILLAAAWLGVLGPAEIVAEIGSSLDFLKADWPDMPERQRSIGAVFDQSWNLLAERERELFQALSVFAGGFTLAAAQQVTGASLRELKALADRSLLQRDPSGRFQIHELLRRYAAGKPDPWPNARWSAIDRHSAYYCGALRQWEGDLFGSRQQEALIEMEAEGDNLRAAWYWAVEQGQFERLDGAMEGLEQFYWQSGRYWEAEEALQAAAAAAVGQVAGDVTPLRVCVRAQAWQSNFLRAMGRRDEARRLQEQCLTILKEPSLAGHDTRLERAILSWAMGVTICMADYAQGRRRFEESYSLFRDLDHRWGMAWALNAWGTMSLFLGAHQDAKRRLEEGLAIYRAVGNQSGISGCLSRLAGIACVEGRFEEAERLAREGYRTSLEAGSRTQLALALLELGAVLENVAKFSEAHSVLEQSLALFTELGHRGYVTQAHSFLGGIDMHLGRYEEAGKHAQTGLALARAHGPRFCVGLNLLLLGCLDLAQGAYATAHQFLQEAVAEYQEVGPQEDLSVALACLASAVDALGDTHGARRHLVHSLEIAVESAAVPSLAWVLPATALILAGEGEKERAVELYALASRFPLVARSRWFAGMAGDRVAAVAETLPDGRVHVLKVRGRSRDLRASAEEFLADLRG